MRNLEGWRLGLFALAIVLAALPLAMAEELPRVLAQQTGGIGDATHTLVSRRVSQAPQLDGRADAVWDGVTPATIELKRGRHGAETVLQANLRSVYTDESVYFLASWQGDPPLVGEMGEQNKLIVHFDLAAPWPGASDTMCLVACHTAFVDTKGRALYLTAETIPPGLTDPLDVGGGWLDGRWTFEWARPLQSSNPFDVQFADLEARYPFFVKVIQGQPGQPDPVSLDYTLAFRHDP